MFFQRNKWQAQSLTLNWLLKRDLLEIVESNHRVYKNAFSVIADRRVGNMLFHGSR